MRGRRSLSVRPSLCGEPKSGFINVPQLFTHAVRLELLSDLFARGRSLTRCVLRVIQHVGEPARERLWILRPREDAVPAGVADLGHGITCACTTWHTEDHG